MNLNQITEIARFVQAVRSGERIIVLGGNNPDTRAVGTPRGIVGADDFGFATEVDEACRYWITDIRGTEAFLAIGSVGIGEAFYVDADQARDYDRELR